MYFLYPLYILSQNIRQTKLSCQLFMNQYALHGNQNCVLHLLGTLGAAIFMCTSFIVLSVAFTVVGWSSAICFVKILDCDSWEYANKLSRMANLPWVSYKNQLLDDRYVILLICCLFCRLLKVKLCCQRRKMIQSLGVMFPRG